MADIRTNAVNAWESTLSSALATGATTINVTDTTGSPAVPFYVVLDPGNDSKREVVLVDGAKTATTFTLSAATSRGQDGTSDVAHDSGAVVAIVPVAAMFNDLHDRADAGDTALATHEGAADPHPDYLTAAEGDALFLTPAEGNAAYAPLTHAARHANGGADEITVEGLGTAATDTSLALKPDGVGGVAFGAVASASTVVGANVYNSTAQSLANGTVTAITLGAETFDTDALHDNTTNPTRLTVPAGKGGKWLLHGQVGYAANATGIRSCLIRRTGTTVADYNRDSTSTTAPAPVAASTVVEAVAGDYFELFGYQGSGGALNTNPGAAATYLVAIYLGA